MISGKTTLIAHIGYPTEAFKAPLIYNPWFDAHGIDAVVVPMGVKAEDYPATLKALFTLTNIRGALVTMPHKVTTVSLADEVTTTAQIAGSANALLKRPDVRRRHRRGLRRARQASIIRRCRSKSCRPRTASWRAEISTRRSGA